MAKESKLKTKTANNAKKAAVPVKATAAKKASPPVKTTAAKKASPPVKTTAAKKASTPVKASTTTVAKAVKAKATGKTAPFLPHIENKILDQIVKKLEEMREESLKVVNTQMQADLKKREEGGDVGDDMDQASNERDREFSLLIHQRHLRRLQQVEEAFGRIKDGHYGLCEGTEEPINPKRLLIMPLARFSLEYQQQQEKMLGRSPDESMDRFDDTLMSDE